MGGEDASEKLCDCLIECLKNADINTDSNLKGENQNISLRLMESYMIMYL